MVSGRGGVGGKGGVIGKGGVVCDGLGAARNRSRTSSAVCGRAAGSLARQAAIVCSHCSGILLVLSIPSSSRFAVRDPGVFSRINRSMPPLWNGGLLVISS